MTLLIVSVAALACAALRFGLPEQAGRLKVGVLALVYGAAAGMWVVDAISSVAEGGPFFDFSQPMDAVIGAGALVLGLFVWGCVLLASQTRRERHP